MFAAPLGAAPMPTFAVPALPASLMPTLSAPVLSIPALQLSPAFSPVVPPALREGMDQLKAAGAAESIVRAAGASEGFVAQVQAQLQAAVPSPVLQEILRNGYVILIKDHITQDRPDLSADFDYTGGLNDWGPLGYSIMVAERIKSVKTGEWMVSGVWRNSVVHECGHAVDHIMGATDSEEFRQAWGQDYAAMPEAVRGDKLPDGRKNDFYYFVRPGADGGMDRARQETWAEGFDVLMRGEASAFNYENFRTHFPRTLAVMRRMLEARYGPIPLSFVS